MAGHRGQGLSHRRPRGRRAHRGLRVPRRHHRDRGAGRGAHLHLRCGRRHRRHFDVCANPPRLYIHGLVRERRQRRDPRGRSRGQGHRLHLGHQTLRGLARQQLHRLLSRRANHRPAPRPADLHVRGARQHNGARAHAQRLFLCGLVPLRGRGAGGLSPRAGSALSRLR